MEPVRPTTTTVSTPLVARLRCGEWLLLSGVHGLMHLEQLEALEASLQ